MQSNARVAMPLYTAPSLGSFSMWKAATMHS